MTQEHESTAKTAPRTPETPGARTAAITATPKTPQEAMPQVPKPTNDDSASTAKSDTPVKGHQAAASRNAVRHASHIWSPNPTFANFVWRKASQLPSVPEGHQAPKPRDDTGAITRLKVPVTLRGKKVGAIEICCGHAGLTAALCDAGLDAIGIDWKRNRHTPEIPILTADLTSKEGQDFVRNLVKQEHVLYVHLAPPCGTYTGAREIPIPQWKLDRYPNMPNPKPLRTTELPAGLPPEQMSKTDAIKVEKGNLIADFCAEIALYCIASGKLFSIENPTNSIIWEMPSMQRVLHDLSTNKVDFHACMWGSGRDKKTSFLTNSTELESLRKTCTHKKWEHQSWEMKW